MINMRFHLVSLVAVFLALGIGVAMGASFIDRATVDTLQNRVDDLSNGYVERGRRIDSLSDQLKQADDSASALSATGSPAISGHLSGQTLVMVVPEGLPDGSMEQIVETAVAAGATVSGAVRLRPAFALGDGVDRAAVAEKLGVGSRSRDALAAAVTAGLARSLAVLSAAPPPPASSSGSPTEVIDAPGARQLLSTYAEVGLLTLDPLGAAAGTAFPQVTGVRYVIMTGISTQPPSNPTVTNLVEAYGRLSVATALDAEALPNRAAGTARPDGEKAGSSLGDIRTGAVADAVSTVDQATEPLGLLAVVYTLEALTAGRVGHYGVGPAASAPFPTVPAG